MSRRRDAAWVFAVALLARGLVVAWARGRFPPAGDGYYYEVLARRLASGAGYTWLWPDGAVTYAAHYPVGFPALLALGYRLFGPSDTVAMALAALFGAAGAYAAHRVVDVPEADRWQPLGAGLVVALHPALVFYTAARMTEGLTAALLVIAAATTARARSSESGRPSVATGVVMAIATLVRPQSLVLAPVFGALGAPARSPSSRRAWRAVSVSLVAFACVAPWTARNCVAMHKCALVSVNGGWNLLIGATTSTGGWQPISVPEECATVWDEARKDDCFERAAARLIGRSPLAWLARAPSKLSMTFDYVGAAPWYLRASNEGAFGARSERALATAETLFQRLLLIASLVACARARGPRLGARLLASLVGIAAALTVHGWIGYVAVVVGVALLGWRTASEMPLAFPGGAAVLAATVAVHAVFFGSGRYGLVVIPFVAAIAFAGAGRRRAGVPLARPPRWVHLETVDAARAIVR